MEILEAAPTLDLPDRRVGVAGDWHGNLGWARTLLRAMNRADSSVRTVLQCGDFWMPPDPLDQWARDAGIERILVTLGNHEPYDEYAPLLNAHPGCAVRVSEVIWLLPRPYLFTISGRRLLSLGGASSVDRRWRTEGVDWWPDEEIQDSHVAAAIDNDHVDVMLTHETPDSTPVHAVQEVLAQNPRGFPTDALEASTRSRRQVDRVWNAMRPGLLFHGHMHVAGEGTAPDGRRVVSLGRDAFDGNAALLDVRSLAVEPLSLHRIRTL